MLSWKWLKKAAICFALLFITALTAGSASGEEKLLVVATIFPLADMAANVGGDHAQVTTLLPPGADPHTFEPRPSQVAAIARARIFIKVGAGLDFWAEKFAAALRGDAVVVDSSTGVDLIGGREGHEKDGSPGRKGTGRGNPHFWLDPLQAMKIVDGIAAAMAQADPERAHIYYSNGEEYKARLAALDAEIRGTVDAFKRKKFVAFHSAWVYFARRYGLEQAAVIEPFPGREPSPRYLAEVVRIARDIGAKAIFAEPQLNPKAAKIIAKEVGIEVLYLDPMGDPRLHERSGYLELMRYNTSVFRRALHD